MFQAVARHLAVHRLPMPHLVGSGVVTAFFWLLLGDDIPPAVVYVLELYLTL